MQWPVSDIDFWAEYFTHEPPPDDRLEMSIANAVAVYINSHMKNGSQPRKLTDFLLFRDSWNKKEEKKIEPPAASLASVIAAFGRVRKA